MILHTELISSFPSSSQERVSFEVGVIEDLVRRKPIEKLNFTMDINQYVTFIEEKIDKMDYVPTIKIKYPFGSPRYIEGEKSPLTYESNYIEIEFL